MVGDYRPTFHDFYDLMRSRVNRILLVSSLYDAFTLEEDGLLFEQISGEYRDLSLTSPPQVIRVSSGEEGLKELKRARYDMVITMARISDTDPFEFGHKAKTIVPDIPVVMLLTDTADIPVFYRPGNHDGVDKVFFWNGDSALFMAITKYVEDIKNIRPDTSTGLVRVILVVEDSPRYYSVFLPLIYTEIMSQTRALITEGINEHEKLLRKRSRPKILLAENYEEAMRYYDEFRDHILTLITDVTYMKDGVEVEGAGFELLESIEDDIPVLVQSSHVEHRDRAEMMGVQFIDKNSDTLLNDLRSYFKDRLGFGDFIFRSIEGAEIARASDINEFIETVQKVPLESLVSHGKANDFSNWLMARGEISLATKLRPKKVSDFKTEEDMRASLLSSIKESRRLKQRGVIIDFDKQTFEFSGTVTRIGRGSLGGKGRGIAFLSALFKRNHIDRISDCQVVIPDTLIIGTDEFDRFMDDNDLRDFVTGDTTDEEVLRRFSLGDLSRELKESLERYLTNVDKPLAVRSSSLLEDSQNQPFAGIYSTYLLPNNCSEGNERLDQLCQAIKLVYASAFTKAAKAYIQSTVHLQEEEKMAVVIQKLVGNQYGDRYYPIISGVIQSINFYPVSPLKREEGIASVALGLGNIVVEGGKVLSFSPEHPRMIPGFSAPGDVLRNSQNVFYSLDMVNQCFDLLNGEDTTLRLLDVSKAEPDGTLDILASTYDPNDNRIRDNVIDPGPKVITFAGVLKYEMIPLTKILSMMKDIGEKGLGRPVEIEFAISNNRRGNPKFSILQIRPLVALKERSNVVIEENDLVDPILLTDKAMGNGIVTDIRDILYVSHEEFDRTETTEISHEIGIFNQRMSDRPYILMGPGRWGTRDRFLGIPINWDDISNAGVIVEMSMPDFKVDPSHGTHFFHNLTSLGIPYLTFMHDRDYHKIDMTWLRENSSHTYMKYLRHVSLADPMIVKIDGRKGQGVILKPVNR